MEIFCECPFCNPTKTMQVQQVPFELKRRTVDDWLREFNQDGDTLKIHRLAGGTLAIQNQRTLVCYFLEAKGQDG